MINRKIYRAFTHAKEECICAVTSDLKPELKKRIDAGQLMTLSLFTFQNNLFLYYECIDCELSPDDLMSGMNELLVEYPAKANQYWVPMMDIFHFNEPQNNDHWKRSNPQSKPTARLNRVKPDKYSRYIFYHYQFQEESPGGGDKYGIIGAHDDLLFFYQETPITQEPALHEGGLKTKNTPTDHWHALMPSHFSPWEDTDEVWRPLNSILQIELN